MVYFVKAATPTTRLYTICLMGQKDDGADSRHHYLDSTILYIRRTIAKETPRVLKSCPMIP